jgi:hypothetical protein
MSEYRVIQEQAARGWLYTSDYIRYFGANGGGIEESELARRPLI